MIKKRDKYTEKKTTHTHFEVFILKSRLFFVFVCLAFVTLIFFYIFYFENIYIDRVNIQ